jgi:two-component system, NtrC family, nitrogen regulation response regulator GlnG
VLRHYTWPGNVRQLENTMRRLLVTGQESEIGRAEMELALSGQPAAMPVQGNNRGEKLSESVARHLRRYFELHGEELPPPGLYDRILREMEAPLIEIALEYTAAIRLDVPIFLGSTAIPCARRSAIWIFA